MRVCPHLCDGHTLIHISTAPPYHHHPISFQCKMRSGGEKGRSHGGLIENNDRCLILRWLFPTCQRLAAAAAATTDYKSLFENTQQLINLNMHTHTHTKANSAAGGKAISGGNILRLYSGCNGVIKATRWG